MTKRDYELIAEVLRRQRNVEMEHPSTPLERLHFVALHLAEVFALDNPRFDEARFMRATAS